MRYKDNVLYRERTKERSNREYQVSLHHKQGLIARVQMSRAQKEERSKDFDFILEQLQEKVKVRPEFVYSVGFRLFFKNQVHSCDRQAYAASVPNNCLSEHY